MKKYLELLKKYGHVQHIMFLLIGIGIIALNVSSLFRLFFNITELDSGVSGFFVVFSFLWLMLGIYIIVQVFIRLKKNLSLSKSKRI